MADIVKFEFDQPVEVALKYPDPKIFENQWGGERSMYSLVDGRVMYLDSVGAARIKSLGVQPGELFFVMKRKNGRLTDYVAFREGQEPPAPDQRWSAPAGPAKKPAYKPQPDLVASVAARNGNGPQAVPSELERQLAESIDWAERKKLEAKLNEHIDAPAEKVGITLNNSEKPGVNGNGKLPPIKPTYGEAMAEFLLLAGRATRQTEKVLGAEGGSVRFDSRDVAALATTLFIQAAREGFVQFKRGECA